MSELCLQSLLSMKKTKVVEPKLTETALEVVKKRYLRSDMKGRVMETPGEMLWRVARHMAKAEINWPTKELSNGEKVSYYAQAFFERMVSFKFVCAGKAMFEAGNPGGTGQLSSCFVLPIEDSIQSIFKTLGDAAVVHKNNGGTGFNFSRIRPHGDKVKNVPGAASGPVDFLKAYSAALAQILQGAKRQGANIAIVNADHPDIVDFITLKDQDGTIKNFNVSVGVTDAFMEAVVKNGKWALKNSRNGEVWRVVRARELFQMITEHAWATGDPGLAFLDRLQEDNPTPSLGVLDATNPCGEIPLLPYESCNLTSICLQNHLKISSTSSKSSKGSTKCEIDWEDLEQTVKLAVRFLDDMIEVNTYALPEIEQMVKRGNRRIGLGVMGFAHMLYLLGIPYDSVEAVRLAERLSKFIRKKAEEASLALGKERGPFPHFDISVFAGTSKRYRNCALTMIAPTGTISMVANCSSGIEPVFSLVTRRRTFFEDDDANRPTREFLIVDPVFEVELLKLNGKSAKCKTTNQNLKSAREILECVTEHGLEDVIGLPEKFYKVFTTTYQIKPEWHVRIQAAWQKWIDNSVSKTVNFPHMATVEDVQKVYMLAWKLGCKGVTIYRDGSKQDQVLNLANGHKKSTSEESVNNTSEVIGTGSSDGGIREHLHVHVAKPGTGEKGVCPECGGAMMFKEGCATCSGCGYSYCTN